MYTMRPAEFDYHRPATLDEALGLLASVEDSRPLAGGHSLLPMMKLRLATPAALVDIGGLTGLDGIVANGGLTIGALATHAAVASSAAVRSACPVLAETAALIGDRQVRNRGTIGGSLAHADPSADYPTLIKALEATITVRGKDGERTIAAADFLVDVYTSALEPGELVTSVSVPSLGGKGAAYVKHRHPASSYAVVGVAAVVGVSGGSCTGARVAVGGATGTPLVVDGAAQALVGRAPSEEAVGAAAEAVAAAISDPIGDTYASGEYRVHLAGVLAKRALAAAFERAGRA